MANLLFITAKEAKDLKKVQLIGRQDPYLKLWVGRGGTKVKTKVHNDGSSKASWDETFAFDLEPVDPSEYLYFEVKNKNMTDSKPIGMGKVPLKTFSMALTKAWHDTYDSKGKPAGKVLLEGRVESKKYSSSSSSHHHATGASGRNALRNPNDGGGATHLSYPGQHQQQPSYGLQQAGAPRPIHNTNNPYSISSGTASDHDYRRPSHTTNGSSYAATIPGASSHSAHALARPLPSAASPNAIYYADPSSSSKYGGPAATASSPYGLHAAGVANGAGVSSCGGSINPNVSPYNPSMPASNGGGGAGGYSVPTGPGASFSSSAPSAPPAGDVGSAYGFVAPLPGGWEEKMTPEGRRFYVDHRTKTTSWVRPV